MKSKSKKRSMFSGNSRPKRKHVQTKVSGGEMKNIKALKKPNKTSSPLRYPIPDEFNCKLSDDLADSCRTYCKICGESFTLTNMRSHTKFDHDLQITRYKEKYGQFEIIEFVYHKCHICGKIVLLDSDAMGGHIKGIHKMKEREYKEKYMIYTRQSKKTEEVDDESIKPKPVYDYKTTFPDFEYSCVEESCRLCNNFDDDDFNDNTGHSSSCLNKIVESTSEVEDETVGNEDALLVKSCGQGGRSKNLSSHVQDNYCETKEFGQGGWSKKLLPTEVLKNQKEGSEENGYDTSDFEISIDYSEESLVEETSSESSDADD